MGKFRIVFVSVAVLLFISSGIGVAADLEGLATEI